MTTTTITDTAVDMTTCPTWCTLPTGHDLPALFPEDGRSHVGPRFGPYQGIAFDSPVDGRQIYVSDTTVTKWTDDMDARSLRRRAADAMAAAEWVEAQS